MVADDVPVAQITIVVGEAVRVILTLASERVAGADAVVTLIWVGAHVAIVARRPVLTRCHDTLAGVWITQVRCALRVVLGITGDDGVCIDFADERNIGGVTPERPITQVTIVQRGTVQRRPAVTDVLSGDARSPNALILERTGISIRTGPPILPGDLLADPIRLVADQVLALVGFSKDRQAVARLAALTWRDLLGVVRGRVRAFLRSIEATPTPPRPLRPLRRAAHPARQAVSLLGATEALVRVLHAHRMGAAERDEE
jgi:hypothetical protein